MAMNDDPIGGRGSVAGIHKCWNIEWHGFYVRHQIRDFLEGEKYAKMDGAK